MPFHIEVAEDSAACARTVLIQEAVWSGDRPDTFDPPDPPRGQAQLQPVGRTA